MSAELKRDISVMNAAVAEIELRIAEIMGRFSEKGTSPFVEPTKNQSELISWWGELHHQQMKLITVQQRLSSLLLESMEQSLSKLDSSIQSMKEKLNETSESQRRVRAKPKKRTKMPRR